jgi:formamidopyrimidine-DNA glycosylase
VPELPEVETIRRQLNEQVCGRVVTSLTASWEKSLRFAGTQHEAVVGQKISSVERRGKVLLVHLANDCTLLIHLRMTGQLLLDEHRQLVGPITRAVIGLDRGQLVFNDQRKFGSIVVMETSDIDTDSLLARLGPEPLAKEFTVKVLAARLGRHRSASVKAALLDQSTVAGLGNIYVDEVLFVARVHPLQTCASLNKAEISHLAEAIPTVLRAGIAAGGSTMRDYRDASGASGSYLDQAQVFGRTGEPCRSCATLITKIRVAGRGTHLCLTCQPFGKRPRENK